MPKCVVKSPSKKKYCIGDFRIKVGIYDRSITAPFSPTVFDHSETYALVLSTWAVPETKGKGVDVFDGIEIEGGSIATHIFVIRYNDKVSTDTAQLFVQVGGNNYDILTAENIDLRNEYLVLYCKLLGDVTKAGAL